MDDDFTFSTSIWDTTDTVDVLSSSKTVSLSLESQYGGQLDDFNNLVDPAQADAAEDDFGDFGDFGDAETTDHTSFEDDIDFMEGARLAGPSTSQHWQPLILDPLPSRSVLEEQLDEVLEPVWDDNPSFSLTSEGIREVEGISQVLVTPESRDLYKMLIQSTTNIKPPNWTRSRIRRQHLIALGIPINLDEILPRANGKPLPPLEITTRPMSAPPGARSSFPRLVSSNNSRAGTPQPSRQPTPPSHFGPKPELDHEKIQKLLELNPDVLTIQPLSSLERHLTDLREQTALTSTLLTHLLQIRESLQHDSETYNGLIAELVGEAQKMKSGKPRTTGSRRGSGMN